MPALKESCETCHDSDRAYFVDARVDVLLADMEQALSGPDVDPERVAQLTMAVGQESCSRCHLVHLPAAYAASRNP